MRAIEFFDGEPLPHFQTKYPKFFVIDILGLGKTFYIGVAENQYTDEQVARLLKISHEEFIDTMVDNFNASHGWGSISSSEGTIKLMWHKKDDITDAVEWCNSIIIAEILKDGSYKWRVK